MVGWLFVSLSVLSLASCVRSANVDKTVSRSTATCPFACALLNRMLPGKVTTINELTSYQSLKAGFFTSLNGDLNPACFILPTCAEDVALIVRTVQAAQCPFAVKSGGHSFYPGANSIQNGITIDLQRLNQVTPTNANFVSVGPGNRWHDVYSVLDPLNITVLGGRVGQVGVGGLLLSGGLSFLSPQYGLACDSVRGYQVVDSKGRILEVSQSAYPDLYWALRGGGSNFGIVTRFDLDVYYHGNFWGGVVNYPMSSATAVTAAWARLATDDVKATSWLVFAYFVAIDFWVLSTMPVYSDPVALSSPPEIFQTFIDQPSLTSNIRIASMADLAGETQLKVGETIIEWDITLKLNTDVIDYVLEGIRNLQLLSKLTQVAAAFQMLTKSTLSHTNRRGGNPLGLNADSGPLIIFLLQLSWDPNAADIDQQTVFDTGDAFMTDLAQWSKDHGHDSRYIYMNYAKDSEQVFRAYGEDNLQKLRQIAKKYDPQGVFQKLMPGGIKLFD